MRHDAAGAMHVLHVHVGLRRRDLAQVRHAARQPVDVGHRERHAAFLRGGEQMQHGVGRAAHGDVERHRVLERLEAWRCCAAARSRRPARTSAARVRRSASRPRRTACLRSAWVASRLPLPGSARPSASVRQFIELAVNMPEQEPQVGQAERSSIAAFCVAHACRRRPPTMAVMRSARRIFAPLTPGDLAGFHRAARDEHRRDVEPHRRHQHAGRDLVAIADAHHRVGAMRVDHVFDAVGDEFARRQAVEHAAVAHGDAVVDGDGVEFLGDAARRSRSRARPAARGP